jgi:SAM-dependent methyltransferase
VYAERSDEPALTDCHFYHTMDVPGHGLMPGDWDLRGGVDTYLGHEDVGGKRVLELGTASGFLCFEMERRGAEVVAYDLNPAGSWDIVPFTGLDMPAIAADRSAHIAQINNSWWFSRRAFGSAARVVYGSVYDIPPAIGAIDVCTFGAILLHLRDPLRALQSAAALAWFVTGKCFAAKSSRCSRWLRRETRSADRIRCEPRALAFGERLGSG